VLVSHPAFGYFCKDYDLEQISIEVEGKEPRPKDVSEEYLIKLKAVRYEL
jgi:zinc transport system substrate-binding protein